MATAATMLEAISAAFIALAAFKVGVRLWLATGDERRQAVDVTLVGLRLRLWLLLRRLWAILAVLLLFTLIGLLARRIRWRLARRPGRKR